MKSNNKTLRLGLAWLTLSMLPSEANSLAVNLTVPPARGDGDAPTAVIADFIAQSPDAELTATTEVIISGGAAFNSGWVDLATNVNGNNTPGFTVATTGAGSGFNAGDNAWNDLDPITEGYSFGLEGETLTIGNLTTLAPVGQEIKVSVWGIGDNTGQNSNFELAYGATTLSGSEFNCLHSTIGRGDPTGSIPVVTFTVISDGTDTLAINILSGGQLNAFAISVTDAPALGDASNVVLSHTGFDEYFIGETELQLTTVADFSTLGASQNVAGTTATVTYASTDPSVVSVSPVGLVTFLAEGSADITVSVEGDATGGPATSNTISFDVETPTITATPDETELIVGSRNVLITVEGESTNIPLTPLNGRSNLTFTSTDPSILTVTTDGTVTPISVGTASVTIDFASGFFTDTVSFNVSPIPDKPITLLHCYDFAAPAGAAPEGTVIVDSVGGANGVIVDDNAVFTGTGLTLPGGVQNPDALVGELAGAYVDLPNGMISALPAAITIQARLTKNDTLNWSRLFDFGNNGSGEVDPTNPALPDEVLAAQTNHLMFAPRNSAASGSSQFRSSGGVPNNEITTTVAPDAGVEVLYVLTYDSDLSIANIYIDGVLNVTTILDPATSVLADFTVADGTGSLVANDLNNWLGRSNFGRGNGTGDARMAGTYTEFKIYSGTMTPAEVAALNPADLELCSLGVSGTSFDVEAGELISGSDYHFEVYNTTTSQFEDIAGSGFTAAAATEARSLSTTALGDSALVRVVEGTL